MSIKCFLQQKGYDVYWIMPYKIHACKDKAYTSIEVVVDTNWISPEYPLRDLFIPKKSLYTNSDWLCVMNKNKTSFYLVPMCVVKASKQVSKESNGSLRNVLYALDYSMAQYSNNTGMPYFV